MRRHAAAVLIATAAAAAVMGVRASPVSAECPYVPAWPEITMAIPTAREIIVGEIVTDFDQADLHLEASQGARDFALRVTHVLRGAARPGDLMDVQYLMPNWPWTHFTGADGPTASCTHLRAAPGEMIALAFDALHPGGPMKNLDEEWIQPPTRYNAVGVVTGPVGAYGTDRYRERVSLRLLRGLASIPQTDTAGSLSADSSRSSPLIVAALIGLGFGLWRFGSQPLPGRGRRVAPGGVRRRER